MRAARRRETPLTNSIADLHAALRPDGSVPSARRLLLLNDIVRRILGRHDLPFVLDELQGGACRLLEAELGCFALWRDPPGALQVVTVHGLGAELVGTALEEGASFGGVAFARGEPLVTDDYAGSPWANPRLRPTGIRAALAVPLRLRERVIGTLTVATRGERRFDQVDVGLLGLLADHAALAIEQAQLVESLALSDARHRLIADSLGDLLVTVDVAGLITFANRQVEPLLGYSREEVVGRPLTDFLVPEQRELVMQRLGEALSGPLPPRVYEYEAVSRDGTRIPIETTVASLQRDEQVIGRVAIVRDLRVRREIEAQRLEAERRAARLEGAVRTARAAAHEFAQPLAIIVGQIELLRLGGLPLLPEVVESLDDLDAASQRLVDTLQAFQRVVRYEEACHGPGLEHLDLRRSVDR